MFAVVTVSCDPDTNSMNSCELLNAIRQGVGAQSTMDRFLALHPAAPGSILDIPKNFSLGVAVIYSHHCSEQWTEA